MDFVGGVDLSHAQIRDHLALNNYFAKRGIKDWRKVDAKSAVFKEAVSEYQQFHGLPVDAKAGPTTQYQMTIPRCGMPDQMLELGSRPAWPKSCLNITTSHRLSTLMGLDAAAIHAAWLNALDAVRAVCMLNATYIQEFDQAQCYASPGTKGMGRATLAWAYPTNSDCHERLESQYNLRITWDARQLRSTMLHEMCHWWGVPHGPPGSLMAPTDDPTIDGVLDPWTIAYLVESYGKRTVPIPPTVPSEDETIACLLEWRGKKWKAIATPV